MVAVALGVVSAGAGIGSAVIGSGEQASAAKNAANLQAQQYQQTRSDLGGYRDAGTGALGTLQAMQQPGYNVQTDPGYQFAFDQGTRAVNTSAAASGNRLSGGTLKALDRYGQGVGAQQYGTIFNRNLSVAQLGESAATGTASAGATAANNQGNYLTQGANASAAGVTAAGNAVQGGINAYGNTNAYNTLGSAYAGGGASGYGGSGSSMGYGDFVQPFNPAPLTPYTGLGG